MKRMVRNTIGVVLVILGLLALVTPITPGSWLIPIGLEILGLRILLAGKLLLWARARPGSRFDEVVHKVLRIKDPSSELTEPDRSERGAQH